MASLAEDHASRAKDHGTRRSSSNPAVAWHRVGCHHARMGRILVATVVVYGLCAGSAFAQQQNDAQHTGARATLISLAAASASLQAYDAYSTLSAVRRGAVEANPVMEAVTRRPVALVAVKAGVATSSILASTHLWKQHHRKAAVALLAITNGMMTAVAIHNASVLHSMRESRR